jgi:predicted NBD/HSP70 family sugar kinase
MLKAHLVGDSELDFGYICRAAKDGDRPSLEEIRRSAWWLGCGVAGLVNMLDLELVVLGGSGFRDVGDIYRDEVQQIVRERIMARDRREIKITLSEAGEDAGAVGAASLVLDAAFAPRLGRLDGARIVTAGS